MNFILIGAAACFSCGLAVGTVWGRKIEQKAVSKVLDEFRKVDAEARSSVNRLWSSLPYLKKYINAL